MSADARDNGLTAHVVRPVADLETHARRRAARPAARRGRRRLQRPDAGPARAVRRHGAAGRPDRQRVRRRGAPRPGPGGDRPRPAARSDDELAWAGIVAGFDLDTADVDDGVPRWPASEDVDDRGRPAEPTPPASDRPAAARPDRRVRLAARRHADLLPSYGREDDPDDHFRAASSAAAARARPDRAASPGPACSAARPCSCCPPCSACASTGWIGLLAVGRLHRRLRHARRPDEGPTRRPRTRRRRRRLTPRPQSSSRARRGTVR